MIRDQQSAHGMKRGEQGYILEFPLMVMATVVILAVLVPKLPPLPAKILLGAGVFIIIRGLHYMLLTPGWQPEGHSIRFPWNLILFLLFAVVLVAGAAAFILFYPNGFSSFPF